MLKMTDYKEIVSLRNKGYSQIEIAKMLSISRKTIGNYLREGEIPVYTRKRRTKKDPFEDYEERVKELLDLNPKLESKDLFLKLQEEGYEGSYRTISRRTKEMRIRGKKNPIYFERIKVPGEIMEGDFTTLDKINIGGEFKIIKLWVVVLPFSNSIFATPYYNETFECFAEGSVLAFKEFKGIANIYRLDNLTPAVSKILKRGRKTTEKFNSFQKYYGFKVHFCNPRIKKETILELLSGNFLYDATNVVLYGPPGTGKTHLSISIGRELCLKGHRVLFITACELVQELVRARQELSLKKFFTKHKKYKLICIDELGYVPFEKSEAELLFQFISDRYEKGSLIITSNLVFSEWEQVFQSPITTSAVVDRIIHHCVLLECNAKSFRMN